ncbi:MAG: hypothetical protein AAFZ15_27575, partial [Bacteroidota bacterium]
EYGRPRGSIFGILSCGSMDGPGGAGNGRPSRNPTPRTSRSPGAAGRQPPCPAPPGGGPACGGNTSGV